MSEHWKIRMGIPKPEQEPKTYDEMRVAIRNAARDSCLINQVLSASEILGSSGEDTYVRLSYHSLRLLEQYFQIINNYTLTNLSREPVIVKDPGEGGKSS